MVMRLAIDLRPLLDPFESGVTVYTKAMVAEFSKSADWRLDLFYQARKRDERIHALFPRVRHLPISNSWYHLRSLFKFPRLPKGYFPREPDLIWLPDRRPFYRTQIPLVMTVHDLAPEKCPRALSLKSRLWHAIFRLKRLLKLCDGILVPSETTAAALAEKCGKLNLKVTYEGANLVKNEERPKFAKRITQRPFFFTISPADPRKRLSWIIEMARLMHRINFVIVGVKENDKRFSRMKMKERKNLFLLSQISEGEKLWLLKRAKGLLALSEYEGFDLPVLEAVKAKCPVLMSDISVHHELYKTPECFVANTRELVAQINQNKLKVPVPRRNYSWGFSANRALLFFGGVVADKNR